MAQSKLSFHLKVLKEAGLLDAREEGRWVYYSLEPRIPAGAARLVGWTGEPLHHSGFPLLLNIVGIFERFLSLWVALAIAAGVALGALFPRLLRPWPLWTWPESICRSPC